MPYPMTRRPATRAHVHIALGSDWLSLDAAQRDSKHSTLRAHVRNRPLSARVSLTVGGGTTRRGGRAGVGYPRLFFRRSPTCPYTTQGRKFWSEIVWSGGRGTKDVTTWGSLKKGTLPWRQPPFRRRGAPASPLRAPACPCVTKQDLEGNVRRATFYLSSRRGPRVPNRAQP